MPEHRSHPGVYVQETPSGVRAISEVDTSVCAFVGRAERGPTDRPVTITSFAAFERVFGGLWEGSRLGFSVRDFFRNGGRTAVVVRVYRPDSGVAARRRRAVLSVDALGLEAASEGAWGNSLRVRVDHDTRPFDPALGEAATSLFTLTVRDGTTGDIEEHRDLVVAPAGHPRVVDTVLEAQSTLVRVTSMGSHRPAASGAPDAGATAWVDTSPATSTGVTGEGLASDGPALTAEEFIGAGFAATNKGLHALGDADLFGLVVIPPYTADDGVDPSVVAAAATLSEERRAMLLLDPPPGWSDAQTVQAASATGFDTVLGTVSRNAALYFPRVRQSNPLHGNQVEEFGAAGTVAGVMARTDAEQGVWKAPAGLGATVVGATSLGVQLTADDISQLTPLGVNCLREVPGVGRVVWGARTLEGGMHPSGEWRYVPVRRTALFIEQSLWRGTRWAVFEPNAEPLWAQIRSSVTSFMSALFRQGAFQGASARDAFFVRCDRSTTTQADIDRGVVTILVGFAPLKPAEFVVIRVHQAAGGTP